MTERSTRQYDHHIDTRNGGDRCTCGREFDDKGDLIDHVIAHRDE